MTPDRADRASGVRDRILAVVRADPGVHVRRVSLLTGMSWNACQHHLRSLESDGVIVHRKLGARVCWYDASNGAFRNKTAAALLREPRNLRVARAVQQRPGQSQADIAAKLGYAASSVHRRVRRMEDAGLLKRSAAAGAMNVFPTDHLGELADRVGYDLDAGRADGAAQGGVA